jgi:hypothetical protein
MAASAEKEGAFLRLHQVLFVVLPLLPCVSAPAQQETLPRPPAVPLVPVDPYFSVWSVADQLTDAGPNEKPSIVHWTGGPNQLTSLIRIDGKTFRIMGSQPKETPALPQTAIRIQPTTVTYSFDGHGVHVELAFITPLLPDDLTILSRPITYLCWNVHSTDGQTHQVDLYYDNTAELTVNNPRTERVTWSTETFKEVTALKIGSVEQSVLRQKGDRVRINWGWDYIAADASQNGQFLIAAADVARTAWARDSAAAPPTPPVLASESPVLSVVFSLGKVSKDSVSRHLMLVYDDVASLKFFGQDLKGYWTKDGATVGDLLEKSAAEFESLKVRCRAFDNELMADLEKVGGPRYAWLGALAYRQSLAASKIVADAKGQPLFFCKENTSNGCMGTVDVFYPQAPLPLLISPSLSKAMLIPVLEYAASERWKFPSAPHDVGTWPIGNGQAYGGSSTDGGMPVEETANMLILVAAVAQVDGSADFAGAYWPTLSKWANYLEAYGRDPANQLCTDDFAGHLAHNANLAAKAICALGAYGKLAALRGDEATGQKYSKMAKEFAQDWLKQADDGDHYRLAFDQAGTWSSKYNLVWDKILDLQLFPDDAIQKEMTFYRAHLEKYGLPLDGRMQRANGDGTRRQARWSKTDWAFWTACLTGNREDFDAITAPIYDYYSETPRRMGLADLYFTDRPLEANMHSRPVIGGVFIKMLYEPELWKKWSGRDTTKAKGPWATLPELPEAVNVIAPKDVNWKFTVQKPADGWNAAGFDDASWQSGRGGFGTRGTPGAQIATNWDTTDIWLRGAIKIPEGHYQDLQLSMYHDEDATVYIDGKLAVRANGYITDYEPFPVSAPAMLAPGTHLITVHCHQTTGGQTIDLGVVDLVSREHSK